MRASTMIVLACAVALAGCGRSSDVTADTERSAPEADVPPQVAPHADTPASALYSMSGVATVTERSVEIVNSVTVRHPTNAPEALVIRATGVVASPGWWNPRLVPVGNGSPDPAVLRYKFVATPPDEEETGAANAVHVQLRVDNVSPEVKTVEVASSTNNVAVIVVRPQHPRTAQLR
jgi:hypothetical protein